VREEFSVATQSQAPPQQTITMYLQLVNPGPAFARRSTDSSVTAGSPVAMSIYALGDFRFRLPAGNSEKVFPFRFVAI